MATDTHLTPSDSFSDEELREMWRVRWKSSIEELTSIEHQRKTWLDVVKPSVHYTYVEFMSCYFDDLLCGLTYNQLMDNGYVSKWEKDILTEWHEALNSYNSPCNDDYNDEAILNDPEWLRIGELGARTWQELQLLWNRK
ncbi:hypothetical protein GCM10027048_03710 [Hymenobacter coalescens]